MDDVFALCAFKTANLDESNAALKFILSEGMPVNIKVGELREETEFDASYGLLHLIVQYATPENFKVANEMIDTCFEFGANWMLLNDANETPGCLAYKLNKLDLYDKFVKAGFRSEILLQKFVQEDDGDASDEEVPKLVEADQQEFLKSDLQYDNHTLQTHEQDGVMMDWETPIMERSAELITTKDGVVLNIGFGMGIIDTFIQKHEPKMHYIIEAHPDVLKQMRAKGWYERPNVLVLEGTWKSHLPKLLDEGVFFDGIYYDTFSEHYQDMLVLFDYLVGILNFNGTFSYFNGLGADRQVCYDVYKLVAQFNLKDYGLELEFENMPVEIKNEEWASIKREYFKLAEYALPVVRFSTQLDEEEGELVE